VTAIALVGADGATLSAVRAAVRETVVIALADSIVEAIDGLPIVVIGDPALVPPDPRVAHVIRRGLGPRELRALFTSLAEGHPRRSEPPPTAKNQADAMRMQRVLGASRRLAAASDLAAAETLAVDALVELLDADRASLLYYDSEDGALWSEAKLRGESGDDRRAVAGLAGFAARTGLAASVDRAGDDPRWYAGIDDPKGDAGAHLLAQPIIGTDGAVQAIIVVARDGRRPQFGEHAATMLATFAAMAAPFIDQLSIHVQTQAILDENEEASLFRREAMEAQVQPRWGDVVRVSPSWINFTYWLLVALLAAGAVYLWVGHVSTYSSGTAVIRSTTRTELPARTAGNVTAVDVAPGDAVAAGQVIAHLDDANQRAAVDRLEHEFQTQLRNHMLEPADAGADASVRSLRLELETARTGLEDRLVRAADDGVVADLRVRPGQHVEPGDIVASIVDGDAELEVIALLPGSDGPQLAPGMELRLELSGYRYAYQSLVIDSVSSDVISPTEARRVLGPDIGDSLQLAGPVVLVRGHIPGIDFSIDGKTYRYHDGMLGNAEVRVRSERILYTLIPGMRKFQ
jgi:membrane fusion protein (multidrug efflux system)